MIELLQGLCQVGEWIWDNLIVATINKAKELMMQIIK